MQSIINIAGSQYSVKVGDVLDVPKLSNEEGSTVNFDKVYCVGVESFEIGTPFVKGASVEAEILKHRKDRKVLVVKKSAGKWNKKNGHRQQFTSVRITKLTDGHGKEVRFEKAAKAS